MRKPLVAGQFYEADKKKLIAQIENCFKSADGFARPKKTKKITAAIIPHAGFYFSGKAAAFAVKEIAESNIDTFIILGVDHRGIGTNTTTKEDFKTPLGVAKNNLILYSILKKECNLEDNKKSHLMEHSIEVVLPFLQYAVPKFTFVPIIVSNNTKELGKNIKKTVTAYQKKTKKKVCVIASSDLTHYGASYWYLPFFENIKENLYALDRGAIDAILKLDEQKFLEYVEKTKATICGKHTISTLLNYIGKSKVKPQLLSYYTSSDILGDYRNAVGYAAIVFEKK